MKNKVLVIIYVPNINEKYEIYIPTNETVSKVVELISKTIYELSDSCFDLSKEHFLLDPENSNIYSRGQIVRDTNIKNSKKLILI